MKRKIACNICDKKFTRKWNLQRHLSDVHQIYNEVRKAKINHDIDDANYQTIYSSIHIDENHNFPNNNMNKVMLIKNIKIIIIIIFIMISILIMAFITVNHIYIHLSMLNIRKKKD